MRLTLPALVARIYRQLPPALRRSLALVLLGMLGGAALEVMTLGAVLPFLAVLSAPARLWDGLRAHGVSQVLGYRRGDEIGALLAGAFIAIAIAAGAGRVLLSWWTNKIAFAVGRALVQTLMRKILHQTYDFHTRRNSSVLIANVQEIRILTGGVLLPMLQAISSLIVGVSIIVVLLLINPVAAVVALLGFGGAYVLISLVLRRTLRASSAVTARVNARRLRALQESLRGIRDVLLDGRQDYFLRLFQELDIEAGDAQTAVAVSVAAPRYILETAGMVAVAALALYLNGLPGGLLAALPALAAFGIGAQRLLPLMQQGYATLTQVSGSWSVLGNLLDLLETKTPEPAPGAGPIAFKTGIQLADVSFRYASDGEDVIKNLSLAIPRGSRLGVVGATGCGKSTLVDLISGLLAPTAGTISIDGVPLEPADARQWQRGIAYVPQTIFLADASVARNIAFGQDDADIDQRRVRLAARQAQIDDHITGLPLGYDTRIGEAGVWLSGGQRQRLGIARALYKGAEILIFDEATSALDGDTEAAVIASIGSLDRSLTVIMIAHRLSSLSTCDSIVRLEAGRIVAMRAGAADNTEPERVGFG